MEDRNIITLSAPAKINLSLRILRKRSDGYHDLETLMAPLSLADEIEVSFSRGDSEEKISLTCNDPSLTTGPENLCVKAAFAFQKETGLNKAVTITLLKRIPHGAGLGGGSSDAATVLCGMNKIFDEPLVFEELHQLATAIGSDVPFFLDPKPRWCRGRGELLDESTTLPPWRLLLIKPPFSISTAWAYQELKNNCYSLPDQKIIDGITILNDLEAPVFKKYLLLPVLKQWLELRSEVLTAWMSGSGSTIVAALPQTITDHEVAILKEAIALQFGKTFWIKETSFSSPI